MRFKDEPIVRDKNFPRMVYRDCKKGEVSDIVRKNVIYELAENADELESLIKEGYRMEVDKPQVKPAIVKLKAKVKKKASKAA